MTRVSNPQHFNKDVISLIGTLLYEIKFELLKIATTVFYLEENNILF